MEIYVDDTVVNIPLTDGPFRPDHVESVTIDGYPYLPAVVENGTDSPYINLPYKHVQYGGQREIIWTYTVDDELYTKNQVVDVVNPILPLTTIKSIVKPPAYVSGVEELTDAQAQTLERKVRYTIQSYTGKFFGTYYGEVTGVIRGRNVAFPLRVISIDSYSDPYFLNQHQPYYNPKADTIFYPYDLRGGNRVTATGLFGYESVPGDVEEAAKILLDDFSCNEANYRQMFIDNVRNADWRFEFRALAWRGTGNATVDDMLRHYQESGMVVI